MVRSVCDLISDDDRARSVRPKKWLEYDGRDSSRVKASGRGGRGSRVVSLRGWRCSSYLKRAEHVHILGLGKLDALRIVGLNDLLVVTRHPAGTTTGERSLVYSVYAVMSSEPINVTF